MSRVRGTSKVDAIRPTLRHPRTRGRARPDKARPSGQISSEGYPDLRVRELWDAFQKTSLAFKLTCVYLFFEYVRPQSVWPIIDILPYAQLSIIGAFIAMLPEAARNGWPRSAGHFWLLLFTLTVVSSIVFAYDPRVSVAHWDQFLPWLVIYAIVTTTVSSRTRYLLFLLVFLAASFKMSQHGFRSWVSSGFAGQSWGVRGGQGWFHNAGELGIQMCVFLGVSTWFAVAFWDKTGRIGKWILVAMPVTAAGTIIATNSRGSVLGGVAVLLWMAFQSKYRFKSLFWAAVVATIGYLAIPDSLMERFDTAGEDHTSTSRLAYWEHGRAMLAEDPLTGIGYFNWLVYYPIRFPSTDQLIGYELPHNILIQAGAELGYPGLGAFLLLVAATFVMNARIRRSALARSDHISACFAAGLNAGLAGYLVSGQFVTVLYYPFFWMTLAMTVALQQVSGSPARRSTGVPRVLSETPSL